MKHIQIVLELETVVHVCKSTKYMHMHLDKLIKYFKTLNIRYNDSPKLIIQTGECIKSTNSPQVVIDGTKTYNTK